MRRVPIPAVCLGLLLFVPTDAAAQPELDGAVADPPHPLTNPGSGLMLNLSKTGTDPAKIDFDRLPRVPTKHAMISDVRDRGGDWVHQHAYLAYYDGHYWAMWSDGPGVRRAHLTPAQHRNVVPGHDQPGTRVSYATSKDGRRWSKPADLSGPPRIDRYGWISRGLWVRDGELLALASHFNAPGYPGLGLSLEAFRWNRAKNAWDAHGTVLNDALNNFPPKRLPSGQYMMTRRDHRQQVSVMIGGDESFNQWQIQPLASYGGDFRPEEPYWYLLSDGKNIVGLMRDNSRSGRLLRTFSTDGGRSWGPVVKTNFSDATSKFFVLRTSRGYYAMVSNANPQRRDPLTLAISRDGLVFSHLFYLVGGRHVDYPHIIEHREHLLIAFSGAKQTMEVLKVALDDVDDLLVGEASSERQIANQSSAADQAEPLSGAFRLWTGPSIPTDVTKIPFVEGVQHQTIHQATADGYRFLHGASIVFHQGVFYANWANSPTNENGPHETLQGRRSFDGGRTWSDIEVIGPGFPGAERHSHGVLFVHQNEVWTICSRFGVGVPGRRFPGLQAEAFVLNATSNRWESRGVVMQNCWPYDEPVRMSNGSYITGGQDKDGLPVVAITRGNDMTRWDSVLIPYEPGLEPSYAETTVWEENETVYAVIRGGGGVAWVSTSGDFGKTWSRARPSNLPMPRAKAYLGKLSTGQLYLLSNLNDRETLIISVGHPGETTLSKMWRIRHGKSGPPRFKGAAKGKQWSYPYGYEHDGKLYVVYSIGKEDCGMSVLPIGSLAHGH